MESENVQVLQAPKEPAVEGFSVLVEPDRPALDIVFIHGFTGHPERTWSHKGGVCNDQHNDRGDDNERPRKSRKYPWSASPSTKRSGPVYWPRDLVPRTVPNARVLTYGYDTRIGHWLGPAVSKNTIYDIARNFLVSLEAERLAEPSRPLLFIAHSLGGIVVKEALRQSHRHQMINGPPHSIYEATCGIIFFGTPHGGADPRGWLQHIAERAIKAAGYKVNEQIFNSLLPSSEWLRMLRDEFGPMVRRKKWIVYSFQEQYGVGLLNDNKVVDDSASCLLDPEIEIRQHIAHDHQGMCRFSGLDDAEYRKVSAALTRVLEATTRFAPRGVPSALNPDDRRRYLDSLRFDQIDARHATIKAAHAKTCKWLLSTSEYQDWQDVEKVTEHHGFLWIKGKPGTGKSTIMKFAYANAKKKPADTVIISFFFNARGEHLEKVAEGMYRSLLFQLLDKLPELQAVFDSLETIVPVRGDAYRWDIESLKFLFGNALERIGQRQLTCFIDALDECEEDQVREMVAFFEHLGDLAVSSQVRFQVCFSSRHYPYITISNSVELVLEGQEGHQQDIANFLHAELKAGRGKRVEEIKTEILERASGIFLWVVLVVQMLNKEYDRGRIHALRKRLDEIPDGLDELFRDILTRDRENMSDLILCLQWVLYAKRPLKREELYFAILVGVGADVGTPWSAEDITNEDMERFIISSSKGLAEVTKSKDRTVQFIHESVRDFFLKGDVLDKLQSDPADSNPGSGHERLKQCCQSYMSIDLSEYVSFTTPLPTASSEDAANLRRSVSEKFPFLEYAVRYVLHHADAAVGDGVSQGDFVENFSLREWINLDNLLERYQIRRHTLDASLLYILAEENLPNLIPIELKRVPHMDIHGERYGYPLLAALANGNKNAVEALLMPYNDARSDNDMPQHQAFRVAAKDRRQAIEDLLRDGRDISSQKELTKGHQTLFFWALQTGATTLAQVLFSTWKIDVVQERCKQLLLSMAAEGHEAVVKLLLATGKVNVCCKDFDGGTPLSRAAANGHEAMVKLLLTTGQVNPDSMDIIGQTPLSQAAANGHKAVVKLLLTTGQVNPDSMNFSGKTPPLCAAANSHEAVVEQLIATGQVDPNSVRSTGWTPLSQAAANGHEAVVKLLLATGQVNPDSVDVIRRTPLSQAAANRYEAVVKLLLATGQVNPDSKDVTGKTPLSQAAASGHEAVVKLLLTTGQVNPNSKGILGQTPLSRAAAGGHEAVVKLLLATGQVNPDSMDSSGKTPLLWAVTHGHEATVEQLLATGQVNPDFKDSSGKTPLLWAVTHRHEAIVKQLLATGQVNPHSKDSGGWTPLSWAAMHGHEAVVKLLKSYGTQS